jgi:hypothetical protein
VLAVLVGLLLVRTRVGLIYEVAKMNALLGLPVGRVKRVNPLSVFFLMQLLVSLAGGCTGGLFTLYLLRLAGTETADVALPAALVGAGLFLALMLTYVVTVVQITSDKRLQKLG